MTRFIGYCEIRRQQRGAHALARFASGRVGQTDDRVAGKATRHVDFHGHDPTVDPFEHCTVHRGEHARPPHRPDAGELPVDRY